MLFRRRAASSETTDRAEPTWVNLKGFSLVAGGPLYLLMRKAGLPEGTRGLLRLGLVFVALTWLPLLVLSIAQHLALEGSTVSFLASLGTHARFLLAVPLFFVAEAWFDRRVRDVVYEVLESNLVKPGEVPRFARALQSVVHWRDSWLIESGLVALTAGLLLAGIRSDLPFNVTTWRTIGAETPAHLTLAGWWYVAVSLPVFQFLLWRCCWRLLIWYVFLWRLARLDLQLIPTHPDGAGGLGGLGVAHTSLSALSFAVSAVLVASFAEEILFGGAEVQTRVLQLAGIVVGPTLVFLAPLIFFMPKLVATKQRGLFEYGSLASAYTWAFDRKWLRGGAEPEESLLGTPELQSLADLANSFVSCATVEMGGCGEYRARSR
jgi:hypothetical protein